VDRRHLGGDRNSTTAAGRCFGGRLDGDRSIRLPSAAHAENVPVALPHRHPQRATVKKLFSACGFTQCETDKRSCFPPRRGPGERRGFTGAGAAHEAPPGRFFDQQMKGANMSTVTMTRELEFFLDLAKIGAKNPACSSGERAAKELAQCALDHLRILDDAALTGFCEFLKITRHSPTTARDLLEE
jgi:hypothetical protein